MGRLGELEMAILIGLPGSGKTTFQEKRFAATHVVVSKDRLRNHRNPHLRQQQLVQEALQAGQSVVVDNTSPSAHVRLELILLGQAYRAKIIGYYFVATVEECLARNRKRTGKQRVPDVAIHVIASQLQPPKRREGFDQLFQVRLDQRGRFIVKPWAGEE